MKKGLTIIIVLMIVTISLNPIYARAGGGSSGGGGGGGNSSGGGGGHHTTSSNHQSSWLENVVSVGIFLAFPTGIILHQRRGKAHKLHNDVKNQLDVLDDQDDFWNEKRIKKEVSACYYAIQKAWSDEDLTTLKDYLTPSLYDAWQIKLNWQAYQGRHNVLKDVRLIKHNVVSLYDSDNDDEDYFWVFIEGKMNDRIIDECQQIVEQNNQVFVEYWKFQRLGEDIFLDKVLQQDEFES